MNDLELDNVDAILNDGFAVLIKHLKQRFDYLRDFKIKERIGDIDKDNPEYKRGMDIADGLPKLIMEINKLRGVNPDDKQKNEPERPPVIPITPQSISKTKIQ